MSLQDIVFLGIAGITLLGAALAVWPKNVFYNAMALILCLFGVAGLFIYLNSEFLAVVEVIIYIGAISIAIIFAIMLSKPWTQQHGHRKGGKVLRSLLAAGALFFGLFQILRSSPWTQASSDGDYSMQAIGRSLLSVYALPFEAVSLILLIAIIGALVISGSKDGA
jgi:NADH-quinone oxidoreductase subunit J